MDFNFSDIDTNIFLSLNEMHNGFLDVLMSLLSNMLLWIPLSLYISYVLIKNFNLKNRTSLVLNILIVIFFAFFQFIICMELVPSFIEGFIHRVRPCYDINIARYLNYQVISESRFGFFASRCCLAFSVATFLYLSLWEKHKPLKIAFIIFAILVSYSRIYLGLHYPGNILISALTGILIGFLSYPIFFYAKNSMLV